MPSTAAIRLQIETALAQRISSALSPLSRRIRPVAPTGVAEIDALLEGGLPVGTITEMVGPESSGRTAVALSFVSRVTRSGSVCAWIAACDALCPESAAEAGVDLSRLLWVRCGAAAAFARPERGISEREISERSPQRIGLLQNRDNVIHVKAARLTALSDHALEMRSRDFR